MLGCSGLLSSMRDHVGEGCVAGVWERTLCTSWDLPRLFPAVACSRLAATHTGGGRAAQAAGATARGSAAAGRCAPRTAGEGFLAHAAVMYVTLVAHATVM